MTSPVFALLLTCLFLGKMDQTAGLDSSPTVRQETRFVSVETGEELTLQCSYKGEGVAARLYWFKQTLGQKPKLISSFFKYNVKKTFHNEFKNNPRFTLDIENGKHHLTIKDLRLSDSATYYCINFLYTLDFSESLFVSVEGSGLKVPATVHQSASESIQPGGSVTLTCTVHTGTCDGEHSVYWFKKSEESQPGLIYTHGDRTDQCERKPNTQTHTCVYKLPMKSLSLSHAGTYYCAVASCGHILFGDGTQLELEDEVVSVLVYFLSGTTTFTTILSVLLSLTVCMMNKGHSRQSNESEVKCPAPRPANAKGYRHAENLYYAALSADLSIGSRGQRDSTWTECVYYSVKQ
ncbi:CD276 antigen homolog [Etheostoma cragini]|uniref:CD276 antigen homolog n=1 Tax=Etheostoma cragini TaxID=417921 RepID=UPI00155E6EAC|nr:CD276 antigen homolog [Etheostoma cragini]